MPAAIRQGVASAWGSLYPARRVSGFIRRQRLSVDDSAALDEAIMQASQASDWAGPTSVPMAGELR